MKASTAEANGYVCPGCGGRLATDRKGQGFVRHIASGRNCHFEAGQTDFDDGRLSAWQRLSLCRLSQAVCVGGGAFVPNSITPACLVDTNVAIEPSGESFVIARVAMPHDSLVEVRRRGGVVEEIRVRPSEPAVQEPTGWLAMADIYVSSVVFIGDPFERCEGCSEVVDVRPGRYLIEGSELIASPLHAVRARWWKEA